MQHHHDPDYGSFPAAQGDATVIGAGIAGPAAAITLAKQGRTVDVYERRGRGDLWSAGTVAVTSENLTALATLGLDTAKLPHLPAGAPAFTEYCTLDCDVSLRTTQQTLNRDAWTTQFNIIRWVDLHDALVNYGEELGVNYHWRSTETEVPEADVNVHAQGVKYAHHHASFTYAGYSVFRGVTKMDPRLDFGWFSVKHREKEFTLNVGQALPGEFSWMFYLHEPDAPMDTEYLASGSKRHQMVEEAADRFLIPHTAAMIHQTSQIQATPIGDWQLPKFVAWQGLTYGGKGLHFDVGDGVVPVRPHTTMGANLGLKWALALNWADDRTDLATTWGNYVLADYQTWTDKGRALGLDLMGK
jgi:hypothetical protein